MYLNRTRQYDSFRFRTQQGYYKTAVSIVYFVSLFNFPWGSTKVARTTSSGVFYKRHIGLGLSKLQKGSRVRSTSERETFARGKQDDAARISYSHADIWPCMLMPCFGGFSNAVLKNTSTVYRSLCIFFLWVCDYIYSFAYVMTSYVVKYFNCEDTDYFGPVDEASLWWEEMKGEIIFSICIGTGHSLYFSKIIYIIF